MSFEEIKKEIIEAALSKEICEQGAQKLAQCMDKQSLVAYYLSQPEWCLERGIPSLQTLKVEFAEFTDMGLYVDTKFNGELLNEKQVYMFHRCCGTIRVSLNIGRKLIPELYFANGCRLRIVGVAPDGKVVKPKVRTMVPLSIFGKNDIAARDNKFVQFSKRSYEV